MERAARPVLTAGAALVAGSFTAVVPVAAPLPGVEISQVRLTTSALDPVVEQQLQNSSNFIENIIQFDTQLVDGFHPSLISWLLPGAAGNEPLANDAAAHLINGGALLNGAGQASNLGLSGARGTLDEAGNFTAFNPDDLRSALLIDTNQSDIPGAAALNGYGGLEGAVGQYTVFGSELAKLMGGDFVPQSHFDVLVADLNAFNDGLLGAENTFNTDLIAAEMALAKALYGTDGAYDGAVSRIFDSVNMMYDGQEQYLNGVLGLDYNPQDLTGSLLVTPVGAGGPDALNGPVVDGVGGQLGSIMGLNDQQLLTWLDLGAVLSGQAPSGIPDGFTPDPALVSSAFTDLLQVLQTGPFGDVFLTDLSPIFTDLTGIVGAVFGITG